MPRWRMYSYVRTLIGVFLLIGVGLIAYVAKFIRPRIWAFILLIVPGIIIFVVATYTIAMRARLFRLAR